MCEVVRKGETKRGSIVSDNIMTHHVCFSRVITNNIGKHLPQFLEFPS